VDQAVAVLAETEQRRHEEEEEEPTPVPMALPTGKAGRAAPSPSPGPRKALLRRGPPSKFAPGGFTDDDIKAVAEAEKLERKRKISEDAERINNDPLWLIPGAIRKTERGRQMWKQIQNYYGRHDVPGAAFPASFSQCFPAPSHAAERRPERGPVKANLVSIGREAFVLFSGAGTTESSTIV
jgi:hypothetical protein